MCKGTTSSSQTTSTSPNPQAAQLYQQLLTQAQGVAATPYQAYTGQLTAPVNAQQTAGIGGINQNAGFAQPYINQAAGLVQNASQPLTAAQIAQYQSPYTQQVVNATEAQFNNQNAQQQQQVLGSAAAQGALGGNRVGVAQANLAGQQQLAEAPTIAGLYNQGYQTALGTAQQQQQNQLAAAYGLGNLGVSGQGAALQGAGAQVGAGTLQQQTTQGADTAAYNQYLQQLAYPFQTTQWLAGIGTGVGSQLGSTSSGTAQGPTPSSFGQVAGLGLAALGLFNKGGKVSGFADGGSPISGTPYAGVNGYVPSVSLTPAALRAMSMNVPQQQTLPGPTAAQWGAGGKQLGSLASGFNMSQIGTPDLWGSGEYVGDLGYNPVGEAHGGRISGFGDGGMVRGYDDGGVPTFAGVGGSFVPSDVPTFDERFSGTPAVPNYFDVASPTAGFGDPVPLPQERPSIGGATFADRFSGVSPNAVDTTSPVPGFALPPSAGFAGPAAPISGTQAAPLAATQDITTPTNGYADNMDRIAAAHRQIESGGNYNALGPVNPKTGDRAYGAYQVMGTNIPTWTKEYLGTSMTPQQFLKDPVAQDTLYKARMGQYVSQYGLPGALDHWLGMGNSDFTGTTHPEYQQRFFTALNGTPTQVAGVNADNAALPPNATLTQGQLPTQNNASPAPQSGGFLSGLLSKAGINLSPEAKQALVSAGFGMMASRSPYPLEQIGQGGQQGLQTYQQVKNANLAAQKLDQEAKHWQDQLALQTQEFGLKKQQAAVTALQPVKIGTDALNHDIYGIRDPQTGQMKIIDPNTGQFKDTSNLAASTGQQGPLTGDALLNSYPPQVQNTVRGLLSGDIDPAKLGYRDRTAYMNLASAVDPSFNTFTAPMRAQANKNFTGSGVEARNFQSNDMAIKHIGSALDNIERMGNMTTLPALNTPINAIKGQVSPGFQEARTSLNTDIDAVANELMRSFRGSGSASEKEAMEWRQNFPINGSPVEQRAAFKEAANLLASRITAAGNRYNDAMGPTRARDPLSWLSPEGRDVINFTQNLDPQKPIPQNWRTEPSGAHPQQGQVDPRDAAALKANAANPAAKAAIDKKYGVGTADRLLSTP